MHEFAVLKFKDGVSKEEQFETMKAIKQVLSLWMASN
jgi:hypothetical protein